MPIRPENRGRYPGDWSVISECVRFGRAQGRCECRGECGRPTHHLDTDGRCRNRHGRRAYRTGARVVLTTAHLNHTPEDCRPENLRAYCQGCHVHHDAPHHAQTRHRTRAAELATTMHPLFELGDAEAAAEEPQPPDSNDQSPQATSENGSTAISERREIAADETKSRMGSVPQQRRHPCTATLSARKACQ